MSHITGKLYVHSYTHDVHAIKTVASGHEVAVCHTLDNAVLFAATTDLLEACKAALRLATGHYVTARERGIEDARVMSILEAAIANAERTDE